VKSKEGRGWEECGGWRQKVEGEEGEGRREKEEGEAGELQGNHFGDGVGKPKWREEGEAQGGEPRGDGEARVEEGGRRGRRSFYKVHNTTMNGNH
jgi:hypothetical protein